MKRVRQLILAILLLTHLKADSFAQTNPPFNIGAYKQFLSNNQALSPEQLLSLYDAGRFLQETTVSYQAAGYFDSIDTYYELTGEEKGLLSRHGFVITERLSRDSFGEAFLEIYKRDLPVFISTDAILHALHMSWDEILMEVEDRFLLPKLRELLSRLHAELPAMRVRYRLTPFMERMVNDLDIYLTVAQVLLGTATGPVFAENVQAMEELLALIQTERPASYALFAENARTIDFSQFTVRGHYTRSENLRKYFQAMMWLGRTEIYLIPPEGTEGSGQSEEDIRRQSIDAVLLTEAAESSDAYSLLNEIESTIRFFVGEQDNITLPQVRELALEAGLENAGSLLGEERRTVFRNILREKAYAFQRINSQILMSDPMSPDQIQPASAFMLLGQRFVIDSYTMGNVVYDRIIHNNAKVRRMLPSSLDVLFALGNNAAAQLLKPELDRYHYSPNLAALRYLVDSYEPEFWRGSIYNGWLDAIRALNPPDERTHLPGFMQTAAWWQQKMNTQLSSWAQLRHDFLLYAKQSYTGGIVCSYPETYVEPIPRFYEAVKTFAEGAAEKFGNLPGLWPGITNYFVSMAAISDTLATIARKELDKVPLTQEEKFFLQTVLYEVPIGCTREFRGWYARLFYTRAMGLFRKDLIVADVHTAPTDEAGVPVGWVLHAGTGPINLGVVIADLPDGKTTAFIGPVMSYYEHVTTNFKRLTDEEWKDAYAVSPSMRPSFVKLYLADGSGSAYSGAQSLVTGLRDGSTTDPVPPVPVLAQNYPNPFNSSTVIAFSIPGELSQSVVELAIYDVQGRLVKHLLRSTMPAGHYATRWDGTDQRGNVAASGVYFYHLTAGRQRTIGKMNFVK